MNQKLLVDEVKRASPPKNIAELVGISTATWYNKLSGASQWRVEELVNLAHALRWSKETLLNIMDFKEV